MKEWRRRFKGFNGFLLHKFGIDVKPSLRIYLVPLEANYV